MHVRTRTWLSFVVAAGLLLMVSSRFAFFEPLENAALQVAGPVETALRDATRPVADFVNNFTDVNRLSDENHALRTENERLAAANARLQEVEGENRQLRALLDIRPLLTGQDLVPANVFAREPSNLEELIAIDRGRADGLREGMVVLTRQGSLVGTISRVLDNAAWVTLITDPTSAVSAFIQESRAQGVVVGAPDGTLTMEFVQETAEVKEGDLVLTSGLGGRHPAGELIGQVVEVEGASQELFQTVRVQPLADLSRLEAVLVLASFLPQESLEP
ncbi:MAG: rod shape-determining protein MreC [Chloroflexi bacterium]|nr:rod shape-determining protein MreC [Chloroflexota bacterium]